MNSFARNTIRKTVWCISIVSTAALTVWCILRFHSDEDLSQIEFKKFHDLPESFYPSITICFEKPFVDHKLWRSDPNLTEQAYADFLAGTQDAAELVDISSEIDYDDVTIKLKDHLEKVVIVMWNGDERIWDGNGILVPSLNQSGYEEHQHLNIYASARLHNRKCFHGDLRSMDDRLRTRAPFVVAMENGNVVAACSCAARHTHQ